MAITINTSPSAINPVYRAINWNATSNAATIKAMRADVYINGVYSTTIDGVQELGSTDTFDFDIRKILQSQLISELRTNITTFKVSNALTSACSVKIRLYEILLTGGVFTTTWAENGAGTGYVESGTVNAVNMATQHQETLTDWTVDSSAKKLLTTSLDNNRIERTVPFQIGFLSSETSGFQSVITKRDRFLNSLGIVTTSVTIPAGLTYGKGIIEIPTSVYSASNVAYIDVQLQNLTPVIRSITYRYKVVDYCNPYTLFWQNHLGGFDHFDFSANVNKKISTRNKSIKKPLLSNFNPEDAGTIIVESSTRTKIKIQTSELSQNELTMLQELIKNHTVVYKWESAGVFIKYKISTHSRKVEDNDDLINTLSVTLEPSNEHISQKGD